MHWEVKGVCTWAFLYRCMGSVCMDISFCLFIAVFLNKWNWVAISVYQDGRCAWCSQWASKLSQVLGHMFLKDPCHYCQATSSLPGYFITMNWSPPSKQVARSVWETERSLLTSFYAPQILCLLIVPLPCWQHFESSMVIWHWPPRRVPCYCPTMNGPVSGLRTDLNPQVKGVVLILKMMQFSVAYPAAKQLSSSGQGCERAFKNAFWKPSVWCWRAETQQKVFPPVPQLDLQTIFTVIQFWQVELSNLPFALCILNKEVPIFSCMREGMVIHVVRDPVTLQNEEIFYQ